MTKYRVEHMKDNTYEVVETTTEYGERLNAYESEENKVTKESVFQGTLSDCESYIRLKEKGYM